MSDDQNRDEAADFKFRAGNDNQNVQAGHGNVMGVGNTIDRSTHNHYHGPNDAEQVKAKAPAWPSDGRVPQVAALPEGSVPGFAANPEFVGRERELLDLAEALRSGAVAVGQVAAATGMGGIGKTQLASAFVHRYGQFFEGGVFWIPFEKPESVPTAIVQCGMRNKWVTTGATLDQQVAEVMAEWEKPVARLLVFDNAEDEALVEQWRPKTGGACLLLTSRRQAWTIANVQTFWLDALESDEAIALLCKLCKRLDPQDPQVAAIADTLGHLPLALHLAGSFLDSYPKTTPGEYLEKYKAASLDGRGAKVSPTGHVLSVAKTFSMSLDQLDGPEDQLPRFYLARAAIFQPGEPFDEDYLLATIGVTLPRQKGFIAWLKSLLQKPKLIDNQAKQDALKRLINLGLLEAPEAGKIRIHRLLSEYVAETLNDAKAADDVIAAMARLAIKQVEYQNPQPGMAIMPQLEYLAERFWHHETEGFAWLITQLGSQNMGIGQFFKAKQQMMRALTIRERIHQAGDPGIATSQSNLGMVFYDLGALKEARELLEKALASGEQSYSAGHPNIANFQSNLGLVLRELGQLEAARGLLEKALGSAEQSYAAGHPEIRKRQANLGQVLRHLGELEEARRLLEKALASAEQSYAAGHPVIAIRQSNLALVLKDLGLLEEARGLLEKALVSAEQNYAAGHPAIAMDRWCLGTVLKELGEIGQAKTLFEQSYRSFLKKLGPEHRYTKGALSSLQSAQDDEDD